MPCEDKENLFLKVYYKFPKILQTALWKRQDQRKPQSLEASENLEILSISLNIKAPTTSPIPVIDVI